MMFELMQAVEEVKYMSGISRKVCQAYLRKSLDKNFFNKFTEDKLELSYSMMSELLCLRSSYNNDLLNRIIKDKELNIPIIKDIKRHDVNGIGIIQVTLIFYEYLIDITLLPEEEKWHINIHYSIKNGVEKILSIHPKISVIEVTMLRSIIFMCIYNYCVVYVYDNESLSEKNIKRFKKDETVIRKYLKELTEEGVYYA